LIPVTQDGAPDKLPAPTEIEIRAQLDRILSSAEFHVTPRARKFLAYVVDEAIVGRSNQIKAYSIAIEVFGRDSSFDAQADPVVRIEAGGIRRALERYYLIAGQDDPVIITLPKGGYVPAFARSEHLPVPTKAEITAVDKPAAPLSRRVGPRIWLAATLLVGPALAADYGIRTMLYTNDASMPAVRQGVAGPDVPKLLVEPFDDLSGSPNSAVIARGLTDEVIGQIAKFKEITVITGGTPDAGTDAAYGVGGRPFYALQGSIRQDGGKLRLSARLLNRLNGSVLWTSSYDEDLEVRDLLEVETDIAASMATSLAQPYGVIFRSDTAQMTRSTANEWEAYDCTLAYYRYRGDLNPQTRASVQSCLNEAVRQFPGYATALALLSMTYVDDLRFKYSISPPSQSLLELAAEAAVRAVELDPQNVRALQAEMLVYFYRGDIQEAVKIGERARAINPNDTELAAEYGFRLAVSGQWARGCELVSQAVARSPGPVGYFETALALCAYMQSDYASAERWARIGDLPTNPINHMILLAILGQRGDAAGADIERQWLTRNAPKLLADIGEEVATRVARPEDRAHLMDGLTKAGLAVSKK
jgi:TolB-like protein